MPVALVMFDFDPLLRLGDGIAVRWQTLALTAIIAATLLTAAAIGRRSGLRADDLLFIVLGVVPGAVALGRLGYGLQHLDVYGAAPGLLLDPGRGGLELAAGVGGGVLAGVSVTVLLGAPVGRWAHALALPLLVALGAGKLAMVLGGSGQGQLTDQLSATAFVGPGPWGSLAAHLPSHPSQAYEGAATLLFAVILVAILAAGLFRGPDGRLLILAIGGWALIRAMVALTWRDSPILGGLGAAGVLAVGIAAGAAILVVLWTLAVARQRAHPNGPILRT